MPKGPKGEKRSADVVGAAVKTMKVHPSQADDLFLRLGGVSRRINDGLLKSALGQTWKIGACPLRVCFTPKPGRSGARAGHLRRATQRRISTSQCLACRGGAHVQILGALILRSLDKRDAACGDVVHGSDDHELLGGDEIVKNVARLQALGR